jgi:Na+/H+ antiporter NhaD/arsenite permease-like protein
LSAVENEILAIAIFGFTCLPISGRRLEVMALATTLAGNLTIPGSVANIIVVESARGHAEVGFRDYARFGIPVTLLTTLVGMGLLLLLR